MNKRYVDKLQFPGLYSLKFQGKRRHHADFQDCYGALRVTGSPLRPAPGKGMKNEGVN